METPFSERDVGYTAVSRFEETFRGYLARYLRAFHGEQWLSHIPPGVLSKCLEKTPSLDPSHIADPIDLLNESDLPDLGEILTFRGAYGRFIEPGLSLSQGAFTDHLASIYRLRCKIAHVKGVFSGLDLHALLEHIRGLCPIMGSEGTDLVEFLDLLVQAPAEYVVRTPPLFGVADTRSYGCLNNLPQPDFDLEGGFIGRREDIAQVRRLLASDLYRVVTIAGAGGVGKTALALRLAQNFAHEPRPGFDAIVWTTAKTERLSVTGIEPIQPSLTDYESLLRAIMDVLGFDTGDDLQELHRMAVELLQGFRILLVVDNLETVSDERVFDFIKECPTTSRVLITSRLGLGEVERRHTLKELSSQEAVALFRTVAHRKNLDRLAALPDDAIGRLTDSVARYPLGIKWSIAQVALGRDINQAFAEVRAKKSDVARFCFEHVYNLLSPDSRKLLMTMSSWGRPMARGVLSHVSGVDAEHLDDALRELVLASLVMQDQEIGPDGSPMTRFALLSLTQGFGVAKLDEDALVKEEILQRQRSVELTLEEAERARRHYRYTLADMGARTDEEKVAAMIAQAAYLKHQSLRYAEAAADMRRAVGVAPGLASLYRNWAVMESSEGHHAAADELMKKATELAPRDAGMWLIWGNIKRKAGLSDDACQYLSKANELEPNDAIILNSLGWVQCYRGRYAEAETLFLASMQADLTSDRMKQGIVNRQGLGETLRRWAEALETQRDFAGAMGKLEASLEHGRAALEIDPNDGRTLALYGKVSLDLGILLTKLKRLDEAIGHFKACVSESPTSVPDKTRCVLAHCWWAKGLLATGRRAEAAEHLSEAQKFSPQTKWAEFVQRLSEELKMRLGTIVTYRDDKGYGFIQPEDRAGEEVFFHISDVNGQLAGLDSLALRGVPVRFAVTTTAKGPRAVRISRASREGNDSVK